MKLAKGPYIIIGLLFGLIFGLIGDNILLYISAGILVGAIMEWVVAYQAKKKTDNH
ncbi:hypothetical protein [Exiguobacterium flavidum]|uniref:hypothetical protein n=1 Tax=Exiguobacterium flavidum TaxID=2184695 RepID=UPI0018E523A5|nr:hypothetical protein [Exiguobacterium flavidum]